MENEGCNIGEKPQPFEFSKMIEANSSTGCTRGTTNTGSRSGRRQPLSVNLGEIGMTASQMKQPGDDYVGFAIDEFNPTPYSGMLLITLSIAGVAVHKTLVDTGGTSNVLYSKTIERMGIPEMFIKPFNNALVGINGIPIATKGQITLAVVVGQAPRQIFTKADFIVIDLPCPYNAIMGQPLLYELKAVVSLYHYSIKFPTPYGVGEIKGSQAAARDCEIYQHGYELNPEIAPNYPGVYVISQDDEALIQEE